MAWRQHLEFNPVTFVKEKQQDEEPTSSTSTRQNHQREQLDGSSVKSFYEDVVGLNKPEVTETTASTSTGTVKCLEKTKKLICDRKIKTEPGTKTHKSKSRKRKFSFSKVSEETRRPAVSISPPTIGSFMTAAQNGDHVAIKAAIEAGMEVDIKDNFGWTALMCATEGGHETTVKLLLSHGADPSIKDKKGRTAIDIAHKRKKSSILKMMTSWHETKYSANRKKKSSPKCDQTTKTESYFCTTCNDKFTCEESHVASTLHLFNMKLPPKPTEYHIPPSNVGYKMLLRKGWDKESGLGREGQGQKFPVKTTLKRDREGLGRKNNKRAKVTHFNPNDTKAVKHVNKARTERQATLSKKAMSAKKQRDRKKEIKFRREFNESF